MKVGVIKYIHRKYEGWEFQAVSAKVEDGGKVKDVVFGISTDSNGTRKGLEIYQGENYIVDSKERSMSWRHESSSIPKKWQRLYSLLESLHHATDWKEDVSRITIGLANQYM